MEEENLPQKAPGSSDRTLGEAAAPQDVESTQGCPNDNSSVRLDGDSSAQNQGPGPPGQKGGHVLG